MDTEVSFHTELIQGMIVSAYSRKRGLKDAVKLPPNGACLRDVAMLGAPVAKFVKRS